MRLPESEKQKITATIRKITDEFRKTHRVKIRSFYGTEGTLRVVMGDEYVEVDASYTAEDFGITCYFIMQYYPGDLPSHFGAYWQNELKKLYSIYCKKLREKAMEVLYTHV